MISARTNSSAGNEVQLRNVADLVLLSLLIVAAPLRAADTVEPVKDGTVKLIAPAVSTGPKLEGTSCYKCHSSGPLAIHPAREDLVLDAPLAAAVSAHIAEQPRSRFFFPEDSPKPPTGKPLTLKFCARCHSEDGDRDVLYQVQSHPIRVMVDFGYMPPNRRLKPEEIAELKAWLELKP